MLAQDDIKIEATGIVSLGAVQDRQHVVDQGAATRFSVQEAKASTSECITNLCRIHGLLHDPVLADSAWDCLRAISLPRVCSGRGQASVFSAPIT